MSCSYPIWNKIQACIYKASKCYGVRNDGLNEILIGTSRSNSHSFVRTRVTHKKHEDGSRTYHFYIDDKLYKKATLKKKDNKPLIELVAKTALLRAASRVAWLAAFFSLVVCFIY